MSFKIPESHTLNLDTIRFAVTYEGDQINGITYRQAVGTSQSPQGRGSDFKKIFSKKYKNSLQVVHDPERHMLEIEGSPHAFVYGQNIYTGDDLPAAVNAMIEVAGKNLGFDRKTIRQLKTATKTLLRVDIAANFRLQSLERVNEVLKQIARQLVERSTMVALHLGSVYYKPQGGREFTIACYAKGPQMQSRMAKTRMEDEVFARLTEESMDILRVELRLAASALRKERLRHAEDWSIGTVRELYEKYFARLKLLNVTSGPFQASELEGLNASEKRYLAAHKSGIPIELIYSKASIKQHRAGFRKRGIDLLAPYAPEPCIPLLDVLCAENLASAPAWLLKAKRVHSLESTKTQAKKSDSKKNAIKAKRCLSLDEVKLEGDDPPPEHEQIDIREALDDSLEESTTKVAKSDATSKRPARRKVEASPPRGSTKPVVKPGEYVMLGRHKAYRLF